MHYPQRRRQAQSRANHYTCMHTRRGVDRPSRLQTITHAYTPAEAQTGLVVCNHYSCIHTRRGVDRHGRVQTITHACIPTEENTGLVVCNPLHIHAYPQRRRQAYNVQNITYACTAHPQLRAYTGLFVSQRNVFEYSFHLALCKHGLLFMFISQSYFHVVKSLPC